MSLNSFPVIFSYGDTVIGSDFVAVVRTHGRFLLKQEEDDGWWAYGVNPSGLAGGGDSKIEAQDEFRILYRGILIDFATDATDFHDFRRRVSDFFRQDCLSIREEWERATHAISQAAEEDLDLVVKKVAKTRLDVEVVEVKVEQRRTSHHVADMNPVDAPAVMAAA